MYFLHINTALKDSFVMLTDHQGSVVDYITIMPHEQSALVNVCIQQLMDKNDVRPQDILAISVLNGPGSYTGLRISLSTAKGLCLGWNVPLILHNYLNVLALMHSDSDRFSVIVTAREGEYYLGMYEKGIGIHEPQHIFHDEAVNVLSLNKIEIVHMLENEMKKIGECEVKSLKNEIHQAMAIACLKRYSSKEFDDVAYSEPFYLKPAYVTTPKNNILHKN